MDGKLHEKWIQIFKKIVIEYSISKILPTKLLKNKTKLIKPTAMGNQS
jgi:hypothetical protein